MLIYVWPGSGYLKILEPFSLLRTGTDTLEGLFGEIRTLVASDRNEDVVRLADRASIAVDIEKIMQEHP